MFKISILFLCLTFRSTFGVRPVVDTTTCTISSDFFKYFYEGLITEYRFDALKKSSELISKIKNTVETLENEFKSAVRNDYNDRIIDIGYLTIEIEELLQKTLKRINNVKSSDFDIQQMVAFIKHENFKYVSEKLKEVNDEIILYEIVAESYKAERNQNPTKLMRLVSFILQNGNISHAVAIELTILKEFTADSNNLYTYEMILLGELIYETSYRYQKYYSHQEEYNDLNNKIRLLRVSLPKIIENLTFGKYMKFCVINKRFNETMFLDDRYYKDDVNKRLIYSWNDNIRIEHKLFNFIYNSTSKSYNIVNSIYQEKLYTGRNEFFDSKTRYVFSQTKPIDTINEQWELIPYNKDYFLIRNQYDLEHLFAHEENDFADEYKRRRVFSWKGTLDQLQPGSYLWALNDCA